jgi:hypothetical protein
VPTRIRVNVTEELVKRATQRDSRHCMIAEALALDNPTFRKIEVDIATIRWTNVRTKKRYICLTPDPAAEALIDFDQGNPVEPFAMTVTPIQVTPSTRTVKKPDGTHTRKQGRGRKQLRVNKQGQEVIEGGKPLPSGAPLSNVTRSKSSHRVFGKKLLRA